MKKGEKYMKKQTINLRLIYPNHYNVDQYIEIDEDVFEVIDVYEHIDSAYERKVRYHKAYYSIDKNPYIELHEKNFTTNDTIYIDKIIHGELIDLVTKGINGLPQIQRKRIVKRYIEGKTLIEIATEEKCTVQAIYNSIHRSLNKIKTILLENGYDITD
jgi:DNA-directed RNA polymerase specialized sigma24 family protein